jgi:hypothetical protein
MALTDTEIRRAKTKTSACRMSDGGGLYLFVTPPGGKLWRWKYRFEGREKLMSFGSYPDVSLSLARERHVEARKLLATGTDPIRCDAAGSLLLYRSLAVVTCAQSEIWRAHRPPHW